MLVVIAVTLASCQPSEPRPSILPQVSVPAPAIASSTPEPMPEPTPSPSGPFTADGYESEVVERAIESFVAALVDLYDGGERGAMERLFTLEGRVAALAYDWRLRAADRDEMWFEGQVSVRGWTSTDERPLDRPPTLKANVALRAAPGAELIDVATGAVLQRWRDHQDFVIEVSLQYEEGTWRAFSVGPPVEWHDDPPRTPPPPVRCPALSPDRPDAADLVQGRTWCFGGRNGTLATKEQVVVFHRYPCGTSRASIFTIGWPVGTSIDHLDAHQFVRDPYGRFERQWPLPIAYIGDGRLPKDAYSTGLTDGEFEIWVSPAAEARAVWARHGERVERWPRAPEEWGVTDCN
jgi:hypothetical protein